MLTRFLAEFFGTLLFVLAIVVTGRPLLIAATFLAVILLTGPISGGHINPAVTLSLVFNGDLPIRDALPYIIAQIAGGLTAIQVAKRL